MTRGEHATGYRDLPGDDTLVLQTGLLMIGSWSNRIIDESRCHMRDRHAFDTSNRDVNYVTLRLVPVLARLSQKFCVRGGQRLMTFAAGVYWSAVWAAGWVGLPHQRARQLRICGAVAASPAAAQAM